MDYSDRHGSDRVASLKPVTGAWARKDIFYFRDSLIYLVTHRAQIMLGSAPYPVGFTEAQRDAHTENMEVMEAL